MARPALAATRAIDIVNFLATHPTDSFTLSDLVDRLDINVASLHAILAVLTESGYLSRHPRHRTYTLGPALVALGSAALEQHRNIEVAAEEVAKLSDQLDLDIAVTARAGAEVVFVARSGSHHPRGYPTHVGMRMSLRPPMGSIFYAWADARTVTAWLDLADGSRPRDIEIDRQELAAVRLRGFSVALEGELRQELADALEALTEHPKTEAHAAVDQLLAEIGRGDSHLVTIDPESVYDVSTIAGPVFDASGNVTLAINLIGFEPRLTGDQVQSFGDAALRAGLVVTKRTRGEPPAELMAQFSIDEPR
jgi:DNA-binding IclR family transcriptional regulator